MDSVCNLLVLELACACSMSNPFGLRVTFADFTHGLCNFLYFVVHPHGFQKVPC
jgi:hypothetical protein